MPRMSANTSTAFVIRSSLVRRGFLTTVIVAFTVVNPGRFGNFLASDWAEVVVVVGVSVTRFTTSLEQRRVRVVPNCGTDTTS